jgi:hypothetical protein
MFPLIRKLTKSVSHAPGLPLKKTVTARCKQIHNTKLNNLYSPCLIVRAIIPRKVTRAEHVARIKKIKMHTLPEREGEKLESATGQSSKKDADIIMLNGAVQQPRTANQKHYKHTRNSSIQYIWYRSPGIHKMENSAIKTSIITITNHKSIYSKRKETTMLLQC